MLARLQQSHFKDKNDKSNKKASTVYWGISNANHKLLDVFELQKKKLAEPNITDQEVYEVKRKTLLAIRDVFYRVIDNNPKVFRAHLLSLKKKKERETQFIQEETGSPNLIFRSKLDSETLNKVVKKVFDMLISGNSMHNGGTHDCKCSFEKRRE